MKRSQIALAAFLICAPLAAAAQPGGQKSFELMKMLIGNWEGKNGEGRPLLVSYRVTAGGSAIMAEIQSDMKGRNEEMISMIHMDGDRLLLTHYCAGGNQPRMLASASPDGKTITFKFLDATNLTNLEQGHMDHTLSMLIITAKSGTSRLAARR